MNIHEYQAKALLGAYGAPVAKGTWPSPSRRPRRRPRISKAAAWVVKAQIHAGGRGKGGGIKLGEERSKSSAMQPSACWASR